MIRFLATSLLLRVALIVGAGYAVYMYVMATKFLRGQTYMTDDGLSRHILLRPDVVQGNVVTYLILVLVAYLGTRLVLWVWPGKSSGPKA